MSDERKELPPQCAYALSHRDDVIAVDGKLFWAMQEAVDFVRGYADDRNPYPPLEDAAKIVEELDKALGK